MIRTKLIAIVLGGLMLLAGAGVASAASGPRDCERRVEQRQYQLDRAIRDHGYRSWQAEHARRDLERARYECR